MACIFDKDNIQLNVQFNDKYDAIKEAGKLLLNRGCIEPEYIDAMIEREDKVSVYIGNGVAIPHGVGGSEKYIRCRKSRTTKKSNNKRIRFKYS